MASLVGLLGIALAAGCSDREQTWETPLDVRGPYKVGSQVLWLDGTRGLAFALDPAADPPVVRQTDLLRNLLAARVDPTGETLLVLTAGRTRERSDQVEESPALSVIKPREGDSPQITSYELPTPFTQVDTSPDGRVVLLRAGGSNTGATSSSSGLFHNPNQVAVVDLDSPVSDQNPTLRTLRSFGAAPLGAALSPPLSIGTDTRRIGVVLASNSVTLLDLDNPGRREITVRLVPEAGSASSQVIPEQVLFVPEKGLILLRARNAEDLYALTLQSKQPDDDGGNDFRPVVSQPSVGRSISDMVLLGQPATHVLASDGNAGLMLVDLETSELSTHIVTLDGPVGTLAPIPAQQPHTVVAYARNTQRTNLQLIDVERLLKQSSGAVVGRSAVTYLQDVVVSPDEQRVLLIHEESSSAVSILDLADTHRTITRIEGDFAEQTYDFVRSSHLVGVSGAVPRLGLLALNDLTASELTLDFEPRHVVAVGDQVVVQHDLTQGVVTVVPVTAESQQDMTVLWGFLLDGLLNQPMKN